jgi:hypothetical protein
MKRTEPPAARQKPQSTSVEPDPDALLCALVLTPQTFARNRFFGLYERPRLARIRKRAARVRGIIRQLAGHGRVPAQIVGEQVLDDRVVLRYSVESVSYARTTSLAPLEAALVHYALHRARGSELHPRDRQAVEAALARLGDTLADATPTQ